MGSTFARNRPLAMVPPVLVSSAQDVCFYSLEVACDVPAEDIHIAPSSFSVIWQAYFRCLTWSQFDMGIQQCIVELVLSGYMCYCYVL